MARDSQSLRQRAPVLPVTMPSSDNDSDATSNRQRTLRPSASNNQRRRRRKPRRWEHSLLCRTIFINLMMCMGFIFAMTVLLNRKIHPHAPSMWSMLRAKIGMMPIPPITPQRTTNKVECNFECKSNPTIKGILNDDYCDCPDGSDEPNSSACSNILVGQRVFPCDQTVLDRTSNLSGDDANGGSFEVDEGIMVFASRVRDGVIDCPNAADEEISTT